MAGDTLTKEQLFRLTGYAQPKRMAAWLTANDWTFQPPTRRGDIPKVSAAYFEARMAGQNLSAPSPARHQLNLDRMLGPKAVPA